VNIDIRRVHDRAGGRPADGADRLGSVGPDADHEGFVRVEGGHRTARGQLGQLVRDEGIDVRGEDGAVLLVEDLAGLASELDAAAAGHAVFYAWHDQLDLVGLEVDDREPAGRGEDHLVALGTEGVLVEVEARGVRLAGKPDHAMAGVGIDPVGRDVGSVEPRAEESEEEEGE
jgi:hypothetical protein